jgi:tRNA A-37 threonylcarbamoyl transferase component Bud32
MKPSAEDLLQRCLELGLFDEGQLATVRGPLPEATSLVELRAALVSLGLLTTFQIEEMDKGWKGHPLVFGEYVLRSRLGSGNMGKVFIARHRTKRTDAALKIIETKLEGANEFRHRFLREFKVLERLDHDNIVKAFEPGEDHGSLYFAMELVPGDNLAKYAKSVGGSLGLRDCVWSLLQAARGLAHAHTNKVIHRDIKPSTLMRRLDGRVVILDMGLASLESESEAGFTRTGALFGTVAFMAPEQAKGAGGVTHLADIYSLGATLYALLAGRHMYVGKDIEVISAHQNAAIPQLQTVVPNAPLPLCKLYERMVAKEPRDRPESMERVARELEQILAAMERGRIYVPPGAQIPIGELPPSSIPATFAGKVEESDLVRRIAGERRIVVINGIDVPFRWCPPGTFLVGSPQGEAERYHNEEQVQVTLSQGFWMGETEVTQELFESVTGTNPAHFKGARLPVENVPWEGAMAFCFMLTAREQRAGRLLAAERYRLPTEAEWEYACRAGTTTAYWCGDDEGRLGEYCWYHRNSGRRTRRVALKLGNAWGLRDMHGNVWEWCRDWYGDELPGGLDPVGRSIGSLRVSRGGAWDGLAKSCRSATRSGNAPSDPLYYLGFRLVLSSSGESPEGQVE